MPDGNVLLGIVHVAGHIVDESFQVMRAGSEPETAAVGVGIDVRGCVLLQLGAMGFHPLRRSQQPRLLAVPSAVNDGASRIPALLVEFPQLACFFQHHGDPRHRVVGPVHPSVMMIPANHPLAGSFASWQRGNHVVDRLLVPVRGDFQVHLRRTGTNVIGDGQRTAPAFGGDQPLQGGEQRQRVAIGNGKNRDFGDRGRLPDAQALGIGGRPHPRG